MFELCDMCMYMCVYIYMLHFVSSKLKPDRKGSNDIENFKYCD